MLESDFNKKVEKINKQLRLLSRGDYNLYLKSSYRLWERCSETYQHCQANYVQEQHSKNLHISEFMNQFTLLTYCLQTLFKDDVPTLLKQYIEGKPINS